MLTDAAPGKRGAACIGNIVVSGSAGHSVKGYAFGNSKFLHILFHILLAYQLGNLCKTAIAGVGKRAFEIQGTVGSLAGNSLRTILISAVTGKGPAFNIGNALQGRRRCHHLKNGSGHIAGLQKTV